MIYYSSWIIDAMWSYFSENQIIDSPQSRYQKWDNINSGGAFFSRYFYETFQATKVKSETLFHENEWDLKKIKNAPS